MHTRGVQPSLKGRQRKVRGSSVRTFFTTFPVAHQARTRSTRSCVLPSQGSAVIESAWPREKRRLNDEIARNQPAAHAASGGEIMANNRATLMPEPTKEDLLERVAELEKQVGGRKNESLEFR